MLDGLPLSSYPRSYLRQQIGIVEQEPFLFSRTIREHIRYGADRVVRDDEIEQAARSAAIANEIRGDQPTNKGRVISALTSKPRITCHTRQGGKAPTTAATLGNE